MEGLHGVIFTNEKKHRIGDAVESWGYTIGAYAFAIGIVGMLVRKRTERKVILKEHVDEKS